MKLIVKEYLASLKERDELDAILPDLLSELGLTVFSRPGKGTRQDGVDVAAVGCLESDSIEKVYLLAIKSGDLDRNSWDGNSSQSLRPSLNEIFDSYIPNRLPNEHRNKPIVICLCLGGDIKEQVRNQIEGYISANKTEEINFEEWNGDKLSELILSGFLREEIMPENYHSLLRKSLAFIDEPTISYKHFFILLESLIKKDNLSDKQKNTVIRQITICVWIIYTWCREQKNLESAYICSERAVLYSWNLAKEIMHKKNKITNSIFSSLQSMYGVHQLITSQFLDEKIIPYTNKLHALSSAIRSSCKVDVNLKLFDILSRLAMNAIWARWQMQVVPSENIETITRAKKRYYTCCNSIKGLLINNPILFSPYKDDQAIDISIAIWALSLSKDYHYDIKNWLLHLINQIRYNFDTHGSYPCTSHSYHDLILHPEEKTDEYRKNHTEGSILYPFISLIAAILGFEEVYKEVKDFKKYSLQHCNFQIWYPDSSSEASFYITASNHGAVLSNVWIEKKPAEFLEQIFKECDETSHFNELSAIKFNFWPFIFLACRHYRIPVPIHFFQWLANDEILQGEKES